MIAVELNNRQTSLEIDAALLRRAARTVLDGESIQLATVSIAVVDDPTMHELNRRYLDHDYPTDVLSFVLQQDESGLEGEIIVSADTAVRCCSRYGWSAAEELLLYVVHGALHLAGLDDVQSAARQRMREKEIHYLRALGVTARYEQADRGAVAARPAGGGDSRRDWGAP